MPVQCSLGASIRRVALRRAVALPGTVARGRVARCRDATRRGVVGRGRAVVRGGGVAGGRGLVARLYIAADECAAEAPDVAELLVRAVGHVDRALGELAA